VSLCSFRAPLIQVICFTLQARQEGFEEMAEEFQDGVKQQVAVLMEH
jgi:hypothetical protein